MPREQASILIWTFGLWQVLLTFIIYWFASVPGEVLEPRTRKLPQSQQELRVCRRWQPIPRAESAGFPSGSISPPACQAPRLKESQPAALKPRPSAIGGGLLL